MSVEFLRVFEMREIGIVSRVEFLVEVSVLAQRLEVAPQTATQTDRLHHAPFSTRPRTPTSASHRSQRRGLDRSAVLAIRNERRSPDHGPTSCLGTMPVGFGAAQDATLS
jgi:hypothetical protein